MKVLTALTILSITSSIISFHKSPLLLGYYSKKNEEEKNKKITLNLTYASFKKKSFGSEQKFQNCASAYFTANNASFNKQMQLRFQVRITVNCKNKHTYNTFQSKYINWNFEILEKIFLGEDLNLNKSDMTLKGIEIGVGAIEGIGIEDFGRWKEAVRKNLEGKGGFRISSESGNSQQSSEESFEDDYWPVKEGTFDTVIPEELLI